MEYTIFNVYRLLHQLGFSWITSRSRHPKQSDKIQEDFKKIRNGNDPDDPMECKLWKVMNEHARNNKYLATAKEFRCAIDNFFTTTLPSIGDTLGSRINDNFQVLKSAS